MDEMLKYRNSDGIIQVYFDHSRPRIGVSNMYCRCSQFFAQRLFFPRSRRLRKRPHSLLWKWKGSPTSWNARLGWASSNESRLYFWHILLCQRGPISVLFIPSHPDLFWGPPTPWARIQGKNNGTIWSRGRLTISRFTDYCSDRRRSLWRTWLWNSSFNAMWRRRVAQ